MSNIQLTACFEPRVLVLNFEVDGELKDFIRVYLDELLDITGAYTSRASHDIEGTTSVEKMASLRHLIECVIAGIEADLSEREIKRERLTKILTQIGFKFSEPED